jgi:hypothetical protein
MDRRVVIGSIATSVLLVDEDILPLFFDFRRAAQAWFLLGNREWRSSRQKVEKSLMIYPLTGEAVGGARGYMVTV